MFSAGYEIKQQLRKQMPPPLDKIDAKAAKIKIRPQVLSTEHFKEYVDRNEYLSKAIILGILIWSFVTGSRNLGFLWSFLGTL